MKCDHANLIYDHHVECVDKILKCHFTNVNYDHHVLSLDKILKRDCTCVRYDYHDVDKVISTLRTSCPLIEKTFATELL